MKAIVVTDQAAGMAGVKLVDRPEPKAAINDVVVQIHASGFTGDELTWPSTWTDRVGPRDAGPNRVAGPVRAWPPSCGAERPRAWCGRRSRFDGGPARTEAGAYVIGTGRAAARQTALDFGSQEFVDLDNDALEDVGEVDLVFDVIGGDIAKRSADVIRAGGTLVTVTGPTEARPAGGLTIDFVVVPDRAQLSEVVQRVRDGRLRTNIGNVSTVDDAVAAFNQTERIKGKTIIRVHP
jgi:NADPH:quinone reductase-like Zn-dependent oxidoreductase